MIRLGLDIGSNSIGWALIDLTTNKIINSGVRAFKEGLENYDTGKENSLNEQRRNARMLRRQTARKNKRKANLKSALIRCKLFPEDLEYQQKLYDTNVYELRRKALHEEISLFELGRILLHLQKRRGFWSPRKNATTKEEKGMLLEISELQTEIEKAGCKTVGEYLAHKDQNLDHTLRQDDDHVRGRHTRRSMLELEFELLMNKQSEFHPELTDKLIYGHSGKQKYPIKPKHKSSSKRKSDQDLKEFGLHGAVFFQRPIYWPAKSIGFCELEPREKRANKNERFCERFRVLSEINNIKYIDSTALGDNKTTECFLDDEQRFKLIDFLSQRKDATFVQIKKHLGLLEDDVINLERGSRKNLKGFVTDWTIANKKSIGKAWHKRSEEQKDEIVSLLLQLDRDDDTLLEQLTADYDFNLEQAEDLISIDFKSDRVSLSEKAIRKLLPHLERGLIYQANDESDSALHAAGYFRRDQLQRRLFDFLPLPRQMQNCPLGTVTNPVVRKALTQLRKLVNAIIRDYGCPDEINVEMTRQMQLGNKKRTELIKRNRENEKRNDDAVKELRHRQIKITRDSILQYKLWESQNRHCLYCGKSISQNQLFSGDCDIDHILPISLSHDNSQSNKVICHRKCNQEKGQQTIYQWLGQSDSKRYESILVDAQKMCKDGDIPYSKLKKIMQHEVNSDFVAKQLTDTGYITKAAIEYLRCLFPRDVEYKVRGIKGQHTATLRREWGLNTVISEFEDSPAWQTMHKLPAGQKNRADHRHHALDAIVIALTDSGRIANLCKFLQSRAYVGKSELLALPWDSFRNDVKASLEKINISHAVGRKVAGPLHEDTVYGAVYDEQRQKQSGIYVVRKDVTALSASEIEQIRDQTIKQIVIDKMNQAGLKVGRTAIGADKINGKDIKEALADLKMPSGVPIKKVRIYKKDKTLMPIRNDENQVWIKPGNTHHLVLFEWKDSKGKTKRGSVHVSLLEAVARKKAGQPVIERTPPADHPLIPADAKFLMSLSSGSGSGSGEMVLLEHNDKEHLAVFKTSPSTTGQMIFALHTDARSSGSQTKISKMPNTFIGKKVTIDLLGNLRWAND